MARKRISLLAADLSSNLMSRVYILAKLLEPEYDVTVIGPGSEDKLWEPLRSEKTLSYRPYSVRSAFDLFTRRTSIARRFIDGDLIWACKPVNASFGLGLRARKVLGKPLWLDIEEWELCSTAADSTYWEARLMKSRWLSETNSPLYTRLLEKRIPRADAISVSNRFLQNYVGLAPAFA